MSRNAELAISAIDRILQGAGPLDGQFNRPDLEFIRRAMVEQQAKLDAVGALVQTAFDAPAYILPGGYPSKPVEAFDLRKALETAA